jgi:hypothetical protein
LFLAGMVKNSLRSDRIGASGGNPFRLTDTLAGVWFGSKLSSHTREAVERPKRPSTFFKTNFYMKTTAISLGGRNSDRQFEHDRKKSSIKEKIMGKAIDLTGQRFGRLVVHERAENNKYGDARWKVVCDCGQSKIVLAKHLRTMNTKSCSCLRNPTKHGHKGAKASPTYVSFSGMKSRCLNSNVERYPVYGGAGITVCDRWLRPDGFTNFLEDVGERLPGTTLGRKNDVGNYEPGNVSWQTSADQVASRRPNRKMRGASKKKIVEQIAA